MTELLLLGNIIYFWSRTLTAAKKNFHIVPYRLLSAADVWIFINLCLAIVISVPSINYFTHGTHITVAHAMGATIGINTMILLASLYYIAEQEKMESVSASFKKIRWGFWVTNGSLLIFWIGLMGAGIAKAMEKEKGLIFQELMLRLSPWFHVFAFSGIGLFAGILMLAYPLFKIFSFPSQRIENMKTIS